MIMNGFVPNKNWSLTLLIIAVICILAGGFTLVEPMLKYKTIHQVCVSKTSEYNRETDLISYRINFQSGHQYVDAAIYEEFQEGDSVTFKCLPYNYIITEFRFKNGTYIKNVQNYYAHLVFGLFYLFIGCILFFFKFKKQEHLYIWSFVILIPLSFVCINLSKVIKGNPYHDTPIKLLKPDPKSSFVPARQQ